MSSTQPLVTIVTVTYNSSLYVRDAIEGVLAQDYGNIEYIIGDDCSRDNTWQIVQQYSDPRIKAYRNETNIGEYPNRNKAIDLATGKYLIFIDGDDVLYPHGVSYFVRMMESFPEAAIAIQKDYFNNILFPALFQPKDTLRNHFYGRRDLLSSSFTSNFFKTALLKQFKLSTKYITGDEQIRLRIAFRYPVLFVAGWVSWPRETPGQASAKTRNGKGLTEAYLRSKEMLELYKDHIDPLMMIDIECTLRKKVARYALHLLRKANLSRAKAMLNETGLSWTDVWKYYRYRPAYTDVLDDYSPGNPLKRGFLERIAGMMVSC